MADKDDQLTIADFREMAAQWDRWRELFSPDGPVASARVLDPGRTKAFIAVTRERPVWELAVSAAGYVNVPAGTGRPPHRVMSLRAITRSLERKNWTDRYPDFSERATQISLLPFDSLLLATPRLSRLLAIHGSLTASAFVCLDYCRSQHGKDLEAFLRCVRSCGREG